MSTDRPFISLKFYIDLDARTFPPIPNYVAMMRENIWTFISFLQDNGLTARRLAVSIDDIDSAFGVKLSDVTDEGLQFYQFKGNGYWINLHRGDDKDFKRARDRTRFERALAKMRAAPPPAAKKVKAPAADTAAAPAKPARKLGKYKRRPLDGLSAIKYDDAKWHYGGKFPKDLPREAGGTHLGMYMAWAAGAGLLSDEAKIDIAMSLDELAQRAISPGTFMQQAFDGRMNELDFSPEGNAFVDAHQPSRDPFLTDYNRLFGKDLPTLYHVADTWETFDQLKPVMDARLAAWRAEAAKPKVKSKKP